MIGTIDVTVQAARPDLPLPPVRAFVGSPSSVRVRNVPRRIGEWDITRVSVTANYPDSTTETAECVLTGGVWVGTIDGSSLPGTSLSGFVVTADGVDEHGSAVSGYILGIGDVEVLTREQSVTPGVITFKGDKGDKGDPGEKGEKGDPGEGAVNSVNGKVGDVVLDAHDVGAYTKGESDATVSRLDADIAVALGAGTQALQDAAAAMSAANGAQSAASSASADAATAFTEAQQAQSAANDAQNTASEARSTAIEAKDAATSANENANRAAGKADTAQSTANDAKESARYANSRLDSLTTTDIAGLEDALAAKESVCLPSSSVTTITSGSIVDITLASGAVNVTFADAVGNALRYCELIVRGVTADGGVTINLPSGMDALYAEGVASKAGINHYIFAEYLRGHWLVSRMTRTTTIS